MMLTVLVTPYTMQPTKQPTRNNQALTPSLANPQKSERRRLLCKLDEQALHKALDRISGIELNSLILRTHVAHG